MADAPISGLAAAVIIAAGHRQNAADVDLLWAPVLGRPLLAWSIGAFLRTPEIVLERPGPHDGDAVAIGRVVVVVPSERVADAEALFAREGWSQPPRRVYVAPGGPRWRDAVRVGLEAVGSRGSLSVVVHDGARPLVTAALIQAALLASRSAPAATAVEPVKETIKLVRGGMVAGTLPRERLVRAQTPQVFQLDMLLAAHDACDPALDPPDEAALALAADLPLATFPGDPENLKVRTPEDLALVEALLRLRQYDS
jgi:2-C-methyl-D-erythritol 4-phosphate cytidylyltransferase